MTSQEYEEWKKTGVYKGKKTNNLSEYFGPIIAKYEEAIKNPTGERLPTKLDSNMCYVWQGRRLKSLALQLDEIYRKIDSEQEESNRNGDT